MNAKELKQHIIDTYGLLDKQVVAHVPGPSDDPEEGFDTYGLEFTNGKGRDVCWVEWREKHKEYQITLQGGYQTSEHIQIMQIAQKIIDSGVLK